MGPCGWLVTHAERCSDHGTSVLTIAVVLSMKVASHTTCAASLMLRVTPGVPTVTFSTVKLVTVFPFTLAPVRKRKRVVPVKSTAHAPLNFEPGVTVAVKTGPRPAAIASEVNVAHFPPGSPAVAVPPCASSERVPSGRRRARVSVAVKPSSAQTMARCR